LAMRKNTQTKSRNNKDISLLYFFKYNCRDLRSKLTIIFKYLRFVVIIIILNITLMGYCDD
jgi:hypothetical protein